MLYFLKKLGVFRKTGILKLSLQSKPIGVDEINPAEMPVF